MGAGVSGQLYPTGHKKITFLACTLHSNEGRLIILVLTIALFILSAGAPSATGSISK